MGQDKTLASGWEAHYKSLVCCLNTHKRCIKKREAPFNTSPLCTSCPSAHGHDHRAKASNKGLMVLQSQDGRPVLPKVPGL